MKLKPLSSEEICNDLLFFARHNVRDAITRARENDSLHILMPELEDFSRRLNKLVKALKEETAYT